MSKDIKIESRYGEWHTLKHIPEEGENVYIYVPAESWMSLYINYKGGKIDRDAEINELLSVDTDGGPYLAQGSRVDGKIVKRVYDKKGVGVLLEIE